MLTYPLAFLAGAIGAVLGWFLTGFAASYLAGLAGVSDMEGGRAMFAFLGVGPFGALAGLVLGVLIVLRYQGGYRGLAGLAGRTAAVVIGLAAATGLGLWIYSLSGDVLVTNGPAPRLAFEIRFPPDAVLPAKLEGWGSISIPTRTPCPPPICGPAATARVRCSPAWWSSISARATASSCCASRASRTGCFS